MIIGDGDIAQALEGKDKKGFIFFASGVSNSKETNESEYAREESLLIQQDTSQHLVYFSSLAVFNLDTRYVQHKRHMEKIVENYFKTYTIIRLGNITWGNNPNTLLNHFRNQKKEGKPLDIQDTYRFIVDKDEFLYWIDLIPDWSCEMNIPGRRLKVNQIVEEFIEK